MFYKSIQRVKLGDPIVILVGNKCDKTHDREVSEEEGATLARQFGCGFLETSAKTTKNVDGLFVHLVRSLRRTRNIEPSRSDMVPAGWQKISSNCVIF